jgi:DNA-binding protein HU-beta
MDGSMNRSQLIEALVASTQLESEQVKACIDGLFGSRESVGVLTAAFLDRDKVQIAGFGAFETRERPARRGHNPRTGERIHIAASATVAFRPATSLRQRLQSERLSTTAGGQRERPEGRGERNS